MASTSRGYPYPAGVDDVDVPADIQAAVTAIDADVSGVETDAEYAFSTWKPRAEMRGRDAATGGALLLADNGSSTSRAPGVTSATFREFVLPFDPAELDAGPRALDLRIVTAAYSNSVVPGVNYTVALYPVTIATPATGDPYVGSVGTVVPGSSKTTTAYVAGAGGATILGDAFTAPVAGNYAIVVTSPSPAAANSVVDFIARLQYRQV